MHILTIINFILKINMVLDRNHSIEYATLELADRIITQMDQNYVLSAFFLTSKAFDTIDHSILLNNIMV